MVKWTDTKSRGVSVSAPPEEKHCVVYKLTVPSSARVDEYVNIEFTCHIDKGTDVIGCLAIENCSGNPGNLIVNINGRDYTAPPGYMVTGCVDRGYNKCIRYAFGTTKLKFTKTGTWTLKFHAGYKE